jgi:hypothetical protein
MFTGKEKHMKFSLITIAVLLVVLFALQAAEPAEPAKPAFKPNGPSALTAEEKEKVSQATIIYQMREKALNDAVESHPDIIQAKVALAEARDALNKLMQEMQTAHKAKPTCQLQILSKDWQCPPDEVATAPAKTEAKP